MIRSALLLAASASISGSAAPPGPSDMRDYAFGACLITQHQSDYLRQQGFLIGQIQINRIDPKIYFRWKPIATAIAVELAAEAPLRVRPMVPWPIRPLRRPWRSASTCLTPRVSGRRWPMRLRGRAHGASRRVQTTKRLPGHVLNVYVRQRLIDGFAGVVGLVASAASGNVNMLVVWITEEAGSLAAHAH